MSKQDADVGLGIPWMDAAHATLADALAHLARAPDAAFVDGFGALVDAVEADFRSEEDAMEGMQFAGLKGHREAHARALGALHHTEAQVMAGDTALGRQALARLADWFTLHQATLDAQLSDALRVAARAGPAP